MAWRRSPTTVRLALKHCPFRFLEFWTSRSGETRIKNIAPRAPHPGFSLLVDPLSKAQCSNAKTLPFSTQIRFLSRHPAVLALLGRFALRLGSDIFKIIEDHYGELGCPGDAKNLALRSRPPVFTFGKPLQNRRKDIDPLNA